MIEDHPESGETTEGRARNARGPLVAAAVFVIAAVIGLRLYYAPDRADREERVDDAIAPGPVPGEAEDAAAFRLRDATAEWGIETSHITGARGEKLLPETMGGGCAFFDHDGDGDPDLLFVRGGMRAPAGATTAPGLAFFRNEGSRFLDVTAEVGLDVALDGMGIAIGDYDGDGDPDVYVTAVGGNRLFRNDEGRRFEDVTAATGVGGGDDWSTGAVFVDHDADGDLDLFVLNYVRWSRDIDLRQSFSLGSLDRAFGPPTSFEGRQPFLFRNEGDGRFTEVAEEAGLHVTNRATGVPVGKSLAVVVTDLDADDRPDLVVANDTVRNFAFRNLGDGRFEEIGIESGLAFDENGNARGAMGIDAGRFGNDARHAIAIGNFANEMTAFYVSPDPEEALYLDEAASVGIGAPTRDSLTFGLIFVDLDLDGYEDVVCANGHVEPDIRRVQASQRHAQRLDVFRNRAGRLTRAEIEPALAPFVGRGLACADVDGDGDVDLVATANGGRPRLLINEQNGGRAVRLRVVGSRGRGPAVGATVSLETDAGRQRRRVGAGGSYLSMSEFTLTFGLGQADHARNVTIRWPDGKTRWIQRLAPGLHVIERP